MVGNSKAARVKICIDQKEREVVCDESPVPRQALGSVLGWMHGGSSMAHTPASQRTAEPPSAWWRR